MKKFVVLYTALLAPFSAHADFGLGLMASYSPNVYLGSDTEITPFPMVSYDNGHLFIEGVSLGYRLAPKGATHNIVVAASYDPRMLEASKSDNLDVQKLDDRDSSFLGGVAYVLNTEVGQFHAGIGTDIGSVHNGMYAEAKYSYHINLGAIGLIPALGYSYNSDKLNEHLYGVSAEEASRTGFNEFNPNWSGRYFVGVSGYMYITKNMRLTGGVRYENLDSEIEKSPILSSTTSVMGNVGMSYLF